MQHSSMFIIGELPVLPVHMTCSNLSLCLAKLGLAAAAAACSSAFKSAVFANWKQDFFCRLSLHVSAACQSMGCKCCCCGAPAYVAFEGKRQWLELINVGRKGKQRSTTVDVGLQPVELRPEGWPLPSDTQVTHPTGIK